MLWPQFMMQRGRPGQHTRPSMYSHNLRLRLQLRLFQPGLPRHTDHLRMQACILPLLHICGILRLSQKPRRSFTFTQQKEEAGASSPWAYFCHSMITKNLTASTACRNQIPALDTTLRANHMSIPLSPCAILLSPSAQLNQPTISK